MQVLLHSHQLWMISVLLIAFVLTIQMAKGDQRVRVNFFKNPKGKWLSFINLKASFHDPDVIDVEADPVQQKEKDFDQLDEDEDRITVIYITPMPLLQTLSKTTTATSHFSTTTPLPVVSSSKSISLVPETTEQTSIITPSTASQQESINPTTDVPDYPINDNIPGIFNLGDFIIPHRLRHNGLHGSTKKMETSTTSKPVMSVSETVEGSGKTDQIDDEDYGTDTNDGKTYSTTPPKLEGKMESSVSPYVEGGEKSKESEESSVKEDQSEETLMVSRILQDSKELNETFYEELNATMTTEEPTITATAPMTSHIPIESLTEEYDGDYYTPDNSTFFNDTGRFEGVFLDSDEETDNDTFVLTAKEIFHTDSLNRNESVLRDLLSNLTHLEMEEDYGSYYRDHGGSFLLPVLKVVDYDNSSVPVVFPDIPLNVLVKLNIIHLANFDSEQMEYTIDLEMEMRWFDVRLANNYSKPIRIREKEILDLVFRPDPYFVNSKYSYFHMISFPNFRMRIMPTGLIIYTLRVTLLPSCSMTFCRFPHDNQQCDLLISSIAYPKSFVNLIWHHDAIRFASRVSLPELRIKKLTTEECRVEGKLIASSCLRLIFALERDGARYIIEKYVPSTLAMMFAWVAPYVPYNYEDVRIITPITVLLTLVQMEKGDLQVRTSYLTSMDMWFGAMKAFSVLSLVESLIVLALIKRSRAMEKQAHRARNEYTKEMFESEKRRLTDLYHRLDTASRYLSPLLPEKSAFGTNFSNPEWANTICIDSDAKRCGGKLKNLETRLRSAPPYKTLACIIQKNMSTVLQAIMCFLFNEKKFREANRVLSRECHDVRLVFDRLEVRRFCVGKNEYNAVSKAEKFFKLAHHKMNDWLYLAIVRDPVDRFLSGYVDKCIRKPHSPQGYCNGCKGNMTCFIITEYKRIMNNSFTTFTTRTFEDRHFFPQSWRCNFKTEMDHYKLIHYSSAPQHAGKFIDDLIDLLHMQQVPEESLQFIRDQLTGGRTVHSTIASDARLFLEKRLKSSPFLLEYVIRMFYWDYKLLGFELPTF